MKAYLTTYTTAVQAVTATWQLYHPHHTACRLRHQHVLTPKNTKFPLFQSTCNDLANEKTLSVHTQEVLCISPPGHAGQTQCFVTQHVPDPHTWLTYYLLLTSSSGSTLEGGTVSKQKGGIFVMR